MNIYVFSDTHGYLKNMLNIVEEMKNEIDMIFHLGDCTEDIAELKERFFAIPIHGVRGNNDYNIHVPSNKVVRVGKVSFLLTHGHKERVNGHLGHIGYWAEEKGADMVLFGHTHRSFYENFGKVSLFNPGSISTPRDSQIPTFGIITITDGVVEGHIMEYFETGKWKRKR